MPDAATRAFLPAPAPRAPPVFKNGDHVGGYEVLARLKSGGMATLYLANRHGAGGFVRPVAIKVVHPHLAEDQDFVEMFADEARLASRVHHPNVVHVEEFGESDGTFFLAMEYVHGCALTHLLGALVTARRAMPPALAVMIALHVADGLHAAHELTDAQGQPLEVVHRDVSPQNVLLSYDGHVKLIDFGVAKAVGRTRITRAGTLHGKLAYMAPEQARAEHVDRRADVYALGIVLWEMLAMRRLFEADEEMSLLLSVQRPDVPRLASVAPGLPATLCDAVHTALAPAREDRFATAREFRRALAAALPAALAVDDGDLAALMRDAVARQIAAAEQVLTAARVRVSTLTNAPRDAAAGVSTAAFDRDAPADDTVYQPRTAAADHAPSVALAPRARARSRWAIASVALLAVASVSVALAVRAGARDRASEPAPAAPIAAPAPPRAAPPTALAPPPPPAAPVVAAIAPPAVPTHPRSHASTHASATTRAHSPRVQLVDGVPIAAPMAHAGRTHGR